MRRRFPFLKASSPPILDLLIARSLTPSVVFLVPGTAPSWGSATHQVVVSLLEDVLVGICGAEVDANSSGISGDDSSDFDEVYLKGRALLFHPIRSFQSLCPEPIHEDVSEGAQK